LSLGSLLTRAVLSDGLMHYSVRLGLALAWQQVNTSPAGWQGISCRSLSGPSGIWRTSCAAPAVGL